MPTKKNAPPVPNTHIPLIRPVFGAEELHNVQQCLASGHVTQGPFVAAFEDAFTREFATGHALAVSSCTTALHLALLALDIQPGDEVIVPALTWVATANAVEYVGAKPIFVDVQPDTYTLCPHSAAQAITARTKAIIPVHLFGLCAPMPEIRALAIQHSLAIVEDAACAAGSMIDSEAAGSMGDIGCFSFHPRKVITTGEGGMLTTHNTALYQRLVPLRNHGASPATGPSQPWNFAEFAVCGYNYRLSDLQAAVGCAQMTKVRAILAERQRIAHVYTTLLAGQQAIVPPIVPAGYRHSWQSYVVRLASADTAQRNAIMHNLAEHGIESRPGTHALHTLRYYAEKYHLSPDLAPQAALAENCTITLPIVHGMSSSQQEYVVEILTQKV